MRSTVRGTWGSSSGEDGHSNNSTQQPLFTTPFQFPTSLKYSILIYPKTNCVALCVALQHGISTALALECTKSI